MFNDLSIYWRIADMYGRALMMLIFASSLLVVAHLLLAFDHGSPLIPLILQGVSFSISGVVIWPVMALIVEPRYLGIAYGVAYSCVSISLSSFPLLFAVLYNVNNLYLPNVELLFVVSATCALVLSLFLYFEDIKSGGGLNRAAAAAYSAAVGDDITNTHVIHDDRGILTLERDGCTNASSIA